MAITGRGFRSGAALAALLAVALTAPAALAHELDGGPHAEEDYVIHTPAKELRLGMETDEATARDARRADARISSDPGTVGSWGPVQSWPVVGVHVVLLADGRVLAFDSVGDRAAESYATHDHTRATIWDPATGAQTPVDVTLGFNIFCSGMAHLADGEIFVAGGNKNAMLDGIAQTHVFDPATESWSLGESMAYERWYPSVTPLQDGAMLITAGGPRVPEVREPDGAMRSLPGAERDTPDYPWMDVSSDGRTIYSGPGTTIQSLDPAGDGSWANLGARDGVERDYGGHAMYDIDRILVAGGGIPATASARVLELDHASPVSRPTEPMATPRRQHNLTVLADGTVLATGGLSSSAPRVDLGAAVYPAELWDPATEHWRTLAAMREPRQYHSTALLLPDGRVLSAGGGICTECDSSGYLAKNAEVFTPPYLYRRDGSGRLASRPEITSAPAATTYGAPLQIDSPQADSITKVAMIRLGSVTHSVNMEQRYVPLELAHQDGTLIASSPANANIAPPGYYMLVVIDSAGVPSVARMIRIDAGAADTTPPETRIDRGPRRRTHSRRVRFELAADEPAAFECRRDGGRFKPCGSPWRFRASRGRHRVEVRAVDTAGNVDPSPAKRRYRVVKRR